MNARALAVILSAWLHMPADRCGPLAYALVDCFDARDALRHVERTHIYSDPELSTAAARLLLLLRMHESDESASPSHG